MNELEKASNNSLVFVTAVHIFFEFFLQIIGNYFLKIFSKEIKTKLPSLQGHLPFT